MAQATPGRAGVFTGSALLLSLLAFLSGCRESPLRPRDAASPPQAQASAEYGGVPLLPAQAPAPALVPAPPGLAGPAVRPAADGAAATAAGRGQLPHAGAPGPRGTMSGTAVRQLFLQNLTTGDRAIWTSTGGAITGFQGLGYVPPQWQMRGAGDLNGDGKEDIVWQDTTTGALAFWYMDGNGGISSTVVLGVVPVDWKIVGVGDYNGDGKDDLLWWHAPTGTLLFWYMDGHGGLSSSYCPGAVPAPWKPTAARDLNGDGKDDILWQNTVAGTTVVWYMSGGAIAGSAAQASVPPAWSEVGTTDLDGDSRQDIVWQNVSSGGLAVWYMDGTGNVLSTASLPSLPAGYRVGALLSAGAASPAAVGIAVGEQHACALDATGAAWCWGWNGVAQLGTGDTLTRSTPTQVAGGHLFTAISAGGAATCALDGAGAAWCWGSNASAQLGGTTGQLCGTTPCAMAPIAVPGVPAFAEIRVGYFFACGRTSAGAVWCWGRNTNRELGQRIPADTTQPAATTSGPVQVPGLPAVVRISAGLEHACALTAAGDAWCWGWNAGYQIYASANTPAPPQLVPGPAPYNDVQAGIFLTCGTTAAAAAYCQGTNLYGSLGNGTTSGRQTSPGAVLGSFQRLFLSRANNIFGPTCGSTSAGDLYCWGANSSGQLGTRATLPTCTSPSPSIPNFGCTGTPVAVAGPRVSDVAVAGTFVCAIATSGRVWCWGANDTGQLGTGTTSGSTVPVRVSGPLGS